MNKKIKQLSEYTWGLGIEHEMHIFHKPKKSNNNIKDFTIFDSYTVVERILEEKENTGLNLSYDDYMFLKSIPFEKSGRRCNNEWVIKMVPIEMPEIITSQPFCSIKNNRDLLNMVKDVVMYKEKLYNILMLDKETQELVKKYGSFSEYPFGMTRYLKCPINIKNNEYIFEKDKKKNDILLPEYNGSYHITLTLPYKESTSNKDFINMHKNYCNQLQWLEPLLLTAYFTGDEYAPGTLKTKTRGSFRVMIIGWGNFAGTDIRLLEKGIGRYAKTPIYWRKNLKFDDSNKLKPCYKPSPMALKENAITSLSSDFRTFGSTNPLRPEHRESGIGMTKPNGVEFRIFDHFSDKYIEHLLMLISLVAENSRVTPTKGYVYENKIWISTIHNIMKNGYKAHISKSYIDLLREKLGLEINTESIIAIDIFKQIYKELYDKNIYGDWSRIFHCNTFDKVKYFNEVNIFPEINKKGWQFAFMVKLNRDPKLLKKFNILSEKLNKSVSIKFRDFKIDVLEIFDKNWKDDIEDIAYFYESLRCNLSVCEIKDKHVKLIKNKNGTINKINVLFDIPMFKNFNNIIIEYFGEDLLQNVLF
jgi:hypothetical protein